MLPAASRQGLRDGAVLLLLRATPVGYVIVCTRRTDSVATHKGQIALPGGAREPGDATLWETALREAREEIGIAPATVQYLGALDDLATTSGYALTPFVGRLTREPRYVPQPREVAEVFEVALAQLLDPASQTIVHYQRGGVILSSPAFVVGQRVIWGVTGRVLAGFLSVVSPLLVTTSAEH